MKQPEVGSRVIMTPEHAKRLFLALKDNLEKYESSHGTVQLDAPGAPFSIPTNGAKS
jgi:hypothetical protein